MTASQTQARHPDPPPDKSVRRRLPPDARKALIVEKAIAVFAEHGFTASTRELAQALGVTQPLLYKYFPTKEALVDCVYEEVVFKPWKPEWEAWLKDRRFPFADRLRRYFKDYGQYVTRSNLVRLHIFAGLAGAEVAHRYIEELRRSHLAVIAEELRHEAGLPPAGSEQEARDDIELVWATHSSIFYLGVRRWIYHVAVPDDLDRTVDLVVDTFLLGAPKALAARTEPVARQAKEPR